MKKTMLIGLALGAAVLTASTSFAGILNSAHDLSTGGGSESLGSTFEQAGQNRICIYCHTPHNAIKPTGAGTALAYSPLWNRAFVEGTGITYQMYDNGTGIDGDTSNRHQMNGTPALNSVSILCMSCHDGVTAMDAYSDNSGATNGSGLFEGQPALVAGTLVINGSRTIGGVDTSGDGNIDTFGDLSNHHPVGMSWNTVTAADPEIAPKSTKFIGATTITIADVLAAGDTMTCASCHDVHNAEGYDKFLHTPNVHSNFCLTCHVK